MQDKQTYSIDFETKSELDLTGLGVYRYAEGDHAGIHCLAWKRPGEKPKVWVPSHLPRPVALHSDDPSELFDHIRHGGLIRGFNIEFEFVIWNHLLRRLIYLSIPKLHIEQLRCTMAQAAASSIRQNLAGACTDVNLPSDQQKDKRGKYLIQYLCKPQQISKANPELFWRYQDHPDMFEDLYEYCKQDCVAEEALSDKLRPLSDYEQKVWEMTIRINERGVPLAKEEAARIDGLVKRSKRLLNQQASKISGGAFSTVGQRDKVIEWINKRMGEG